MSTPACVAAALTGEGGPASRTVIGLIGVFAFLNVYSMQSVLPLLMHDFQASPVEVGATVGATVLAVALLSPFVGMLSDALGRKGLLCGAMLFLTVPTALIPLAASLSQVVILRFAQGLAIPGITVVLMAYIGEEFEGRGMARTMAAYVAGSVLGGFSGRFITGHAGEWLGWRGAFALLAVLNLVGALIALWKLPPSRNFRPHRDFRRGLATLAGHLHNRHLLAACMVGACVLFSLVGAFTYVNVLLAEPPFGLSPAGLANVFCVYLLGVAVTPLAGRLIHRFGYRRILVVALAVSCLGLLLTLVPRLALVIAGLAVGSSGIFFAQSAAISYIAANIEEGRSLASGLYNMSYYGGGAVGAWVCGWAYMHAGWTGTVAAVVLGQALAIGLAAIGWRESRSA